jgi:hypothetical protein
MGVYSGAVVEEGVVVVEGVLRGFTLMGIIVGVSSLGFFSEKKRFNL